MNRPAGSSLTTLEAARTYHGRGWRIIPIARGSKAPSIERWRELAIPESGLQRYFGNGENIGLVLGEASGGLVDVDCDAPEVRQIVNKFLPDTGLIHGRASSRGSHYWFCCITPPKSERLCDVDGSVLVELRSTGLQTVLPPSVHPSGEPLEWERDGEPSSISPEALSLILHELGAVALIARHWPKLGQRNDTANALAGLLLRRGMTETKAADFVAAVAEAAKDDELRQRVRDVLSTGKRLASGGTATGAPTLSKLIGKDVVTRACEWLGFRFDDSLHSIAQSGPAESWPEPLAEEAFYGLAGKFVRALEPHTEADPAALLLQFLVCFGNVVGRKAFFEVEADHHFTNISALIVGTTSKGRKGTSWSHVRRIFSNMDSFWESSRVLSGLSSGEGLIWQVRDLISKTSTEDGETKTEIVDEGVADKRLLVIEAEFGSILRNLDRTGNTLSGTVREAWDRGNIQSLTKNSPARATGAHISIIGHVTRDEFLRYLGTTETVNGFANRFLFVCARRSKLLPEGGSFDEGALTVLFDELRIAVEFASRTNKLVRNEEARHVWIEVYGELSEGRLGLSGAATSRAEAQVVRLSLIYALLDSSSVIRREHLLGALAVWEYCEASAKFIFGDSLGDPIADEILRALCASEQGLTRTEIRDLFKRNRSEAEITRALNLLSQHGLASMRRIETEGRSAERWKSTRATTKTTDTTEG